VLVVDSIPSTISSTTETDVTVEAVSDFEC